MAITRPTEPAFTQPTLYRKIAAHPQVSAIYTEETHRRRQQLHARRGRRHQGRIHCRAPKANLEKERKARMKPRRPPSAPRPTRSPPSRARSRPVFNSPRYNHSPSADTGVPPELIAKVVKGLTHVPTNFKLNPKIKRLGSMRARRRMSKAALWTGPSARPLRLRLAPLASKARPCHASAARDGKDAALSRSATPSSTMWTRAKPTRRSTSSK